MFEYTLIHTKHLFITAFNNNLPKKWMHLSLQGNYLWQKKFDFILFIYLFSREYSFNRFIFCSIPCLIVDNNTLSSIKAKMCSHLRKPFTPQLSLILVIRSFTNITNNTHEVGEPCLTPTAAGMTAVPIPLFVTLYMLTRAVNMNALHPSLFSVLNKTLRDTLPYVIAKSTNVTIQIACFLLLAKSVYNRRVTTCSTTPLPSPLATRLLLMRDKPRSEPGT